MSLKLSDTRVYAPQWPSVWCVPPAEEGGARPVGKAAVGTVAACAMARRRRKAAPRIALGANPVMADGLRMEVGYRKGGRRQPWKVQRIFSDPKKSEIPAQTSDPKRTKSRFVLSHLQVAEVGFRTSRKWTGP